MILLQAVLLFTWWAFALADGSVDAYHWDRVERKGGKRPRNLHPLLWLRRGLAFGGQVATCVHFGWWWMLAGMVLVFSFIHDGSYYSRRHKLNEKIYPLGWFSHEEETDERAPLLWRLWEPKPRTIMFAIGVVLIAVHFIR